MPYLKELEKKMEGKNITFLGLSTDEDKADGRKWSNRAHSPAFNFCLGEGVNSNGIIISTASLISFLLIRMARLLTPKLSVLFPGRRKDFKRSSQYLIEISYFC